MSIRAEDNVSDFLCMSTKYLEISFYLFDFVIIYSF